MKVHVVVDFMHIYYKYFYQLKSGRLKRLSAPVNTNGTFIEFDTSLIYYPLRDIEKMRRAYEDAGYETTVSVCFDMPSVRTDEDVDGASDYKAGRVNPFSDDDFQRLDMLCDMLEIAGYNSYRIPGYEADDIVNHLCTAYKDDFDYTIIYTNDKDLLVNINEKVLAMRFKQTMGYTRVDMNNYEEYLKAEFGANIPYNAIGLFLSTVGDSADNIKGIHKFGKAAFNKLIDKLNAEYDINWAECGDYEKLSKVTELCRKFLTDEQYEQMQAAFALVSNMSVDTAQIHYPSNKSSSAKREEAYGKYNMLSLML